MERTSRERWLEQQQQLRIDLRNDFRAQVRRAVPCTDCPAKIGEPCRKKNGAPRISNHESRVAAAKELGVGWASRW